MAKGELALRPQGTVEEFMAILMDELEPPEISTDPEAISREIMQQLFDAESDADMEIVGNATSWQDLLGVPVELHGFRWRPSAYDQGAKVFVVVVANRMDNGEKVVLTTGAQNVLAALANFERRKRWPVVVRLLESEKETAKGFRPLWLEVLGNKPEE